MKFRCNFWGLFRNLGIKYKEKHKGQTTIMLTIMVMFLMIGYAIVIVYRLYSLRNQ